MSPKEEASLKRPRRGHGRPTLHDVAILASVTRITVSRFLRSEALVAPATAQRIREAVATTGYVQNFQAGHLASGRSKVVAALIPSINNSIFAETVQALGEGLSNSGFELLLASTSYDMAREEAQLSALVGWAPAAIVVTGRQHTARTLKILANEQAMGTPVVEIWDQRQSNDSGPQFACIGFNHAEVGHAMARHLLAKGHTHIAYVFGAVSSDHRAQERGDAFAAVVAAAGVRLTALRAGGPDPLDAGRQALQALLACSPAITAVAFSNDNLACGALLEASTRGISVPETLSLLGFGDFPFARQLSPSLSTVSPPRGAIGTAAAKALLVALDSGEPVGDVSLPWQLLQRASTDWVCRKRK